MKTGLFFLPRRKARYYWLLLTAFSAFFAAAAPEGSNDGLADQIAALLNARNAGKGVTQTVTIKTPEDKRPVCPSPKLTLPENNRLTGNMSVIVQCERKQFIQIQVNAEGNYWVTTGTIQPGAVIGSQDIQPHSGPLNGLPAGLAFVTENIVGSVATRTLIAGQPVLHNQLRRQWRIKSGEKVDVVIAGEGFHIRGRGTAMTNAAISDSVRVRMDSGKLVSGKVDESGIINIIL